MLGVVLRVITPLSGCLQQIVWMAVSTGMSATVVVSLVLALVSSVLSLVFVGMFAFDRYNDHRSTVIFMSESKEQTSGL